MSRGLVFGLSGWRNRFHLSPRSPQEEGLSALLPPMGEEWPCCAHHCPRPLQVLTAEDSRVFSKREQPPASRESEILPGSHGPPLPGPERAKASVPAPLQAAKVSCVGAQAREAEVGAGQEGGPGFGQPRAPALVLGLRAPGGRHLGLQNHSVAAAGMGAEPPESAGLKALWAWGRHTGSPPLPQLQPGVGLLGFPESQL